MARHGLETNMTYEEAMEWLAGAPKSRMVTRRWWYDSYGVYYVIQTDPDYVVSKSDKAWSDRHYVCDRDFNPSVDEHIDHAYPVNYDWKPNQGEQDATDWRKYENF